MIKLNLQTNKQQIYWSIFFLVLYVIIFCLVGSKEWMFNKINTFDPWMYVGYGQHYDDPSFMAGNYKISRLPWILIEFFLNKNFSPILANHIWVVSYLLICSLSFFFIIRHFFGNLTAYLVSCLLAAHPEFHGSHGWHYHNASAAMFYLLALVFLVYSFSTKKNLIKYIFMFLFGAFYILSIHSSITFINITPVSILFYLSICYKHKRFNLIKLTLFSFIGATLITIILGFINKSYGYRFDFFTPIIEIIFNKFSSSKDATGWDNLEIWFQPFGRWVFAWSGLYLVLPFSMLCFSIVYCFLKREIILKSLNHLTKEGDKSNVIGCLFIFQFLLIIFCYFMLYVKKINGFDYDYYTFPLIIPCLFCLSVFVKKISRNSIINLTSLLIIPLSIFFFVKFHSLFFTLLSEFISFKLLRSSIFVFIACVASSILIYITINNKYNFVLTVILLSVINSFLIFDLYNNPYSIFSKSELRKNNYLATIEASNYIYKHLSKKNAKIYIWFDEDEVLLASKTKFKQDFKTSHLGRTITYTGFGSYSFFPTWSQPLPKLHEIKGKYFEKFKSGDSDTFVVLTNDNKNHNKVIKNFSKNGINLQLINKLDLAKNNYSMAVFVYKLIK